MNTHQTDHLDNADCFVVPYPPSFRLTFGNAHDTKTTSKSNKQGHRLSGDRTYGQQQP